MVSCFKLSLLTTTALTIIFYLLFNFLSDRDSDRLRNLEENTNGDSNCSTQAQYTFASSSTIKIGILHSLTGTMSISENTVVDSVLLAIEEINGKGGILGMKIEPILEDGASDWPTFSEKAQTLIDSDQVSAVFGCWTSASRKAVLPVFEFKDHLLFYPVQYEGQECSKNIFYTGAAPNQQITPAVQWLAKQYPGKDFFLIGSDYVFPRTANAIIRNQVTGEIKQKSMEQYIQLGSSEVDSIFTNIKSFLPNGGIIFNTLNGDTNLAFFKKYKELGFTIDKYPTLSVSISEEEIKSMGIDLLVGHFAAWNYFMTVESEANKQFITAFQNKYGKDRVINDPMEAAYIAVYIWKQAVEQAKSLDLKEVRKAVMGQEFNAPEGKVKMGNNHHLSKYVRIGKVNAKGLFDIVMESEMTAAQPWNKWIPADANNPCDWSSEP
jgi:urea transport system substrate-binding protein